MKKRILALALTLAMLLSVLPVQVFATEPVTEGIQTEQIQEPVTTNPVPQEPAQEQRENSAQVQETEPSEAEPPKRDAAHTNHYMSVDTTNPQNPGDDTVNFTEWKTTSGFANIDGNRYLTQDIYLTGMVANTPNLSRPVNLCLNGYSIYLDSPFLGYYGAINICDCRGGGKIICNGIDDEANEIYEANTIDIPPEYGYCYLTIYGGEIISENGYGIRLAFPDGSLTLYGGVVIGADADIYLGAGKKINIGAGFAPAQGVTYKVQVDADRVALLNAGEAVQITEGYGASGYTGEMPFESGHDGYVTFIKEVNGSNEVFIGTMPHKHPDMEFAIALDNQKFNTYIENKVDGHIVLPAGNYYLTEDITPLGNIDSLDNSEVHLCLNGKTIYGYTDVMAKANSSLYVYDCTGEGEWQIQHLYAGTNSKDYPFGSVYIKGGTLIFNASTNVYQPILTHGTSTQIVIDGGTVNGSEASSTQALIGTYVWNRVDQVISLISGVVLADSNYGCVESKYATIEMGSKDKPCTIILSNEVENGPEIALYNGKTIQIKGLLQPSGDETYVVMVEDAVANTITKNNPVKITDGFSTSGNTVNPFKSWHPEYDTFINEEDGEVYIGLPSHSHAVTEGSEVVDFQILSIPAEGITLTTGDYVLYNTATLSGNITVTGNVNLCLNGNTIDLGSSKITIEEGASLSVCDCSNGMTGTITSTTTDSLMDVNEGGELYIYGGNFLATSGTAIYVEGEFYLAGGPVITGGTVDIDLPHGNVIHIIGEISPKDGETYSVAVDKSLYTADKHEIQFTQDWIKNGNSNSAYFVGVNPTFEVIEKDGELYLKAHIHVLDDDEFILYDIALTEELCNANIGSSAERVRLPKGNYLVVEKIDAGSILVFFQTGMSHLCLCGWDVTTQGNTLDPGIWVENDAHLRIDDCQEICGSIKACYFQSPAYYQVRGSITLVNGRLIADTSQGNGWLGYGVAVATVGEFILEGGVVEANTYGHINDGDSIGRFYGGKITSNRYAVDVDGGTVYLHGSPVLVTPDAPDCGDFFIEDKNKVIHIDGPLLPNGETETYSILHVTDPTVGNPVLFTEGWEEYADLDYIPFYSSEGYLVRELLNAATGKKELYLVCPEVTCVVEPEATGTLTASPNFGKRGTTITLTATPAEEYKLKQITISYTVEGNEPVKQILTPNENGVVTFTMPLADVEAKAVFVDAAHKHYMAVDTVVGGEHAAFVNFVTELTRDNIADYVVDGALLAGDYVLMDDCSLADSIQINSEVNFCLNGYTLNMGSGKIDIAEGGSLHICDCSEDMTGTITSTTTDSLMDVNEGGELYIYGGNFLATSGTAIYVEGEFYLAGGPVISCKPVTRDHYRYSNVNADIKLARGKLINILGEIAPKDGETYSVLVDKSLYTATKHDIQFTKDWTVKGNGNAAFFIGANPAFVVIEKDNELYQHAHIHDLGNGEFELYDNVLTQENILGFPNNDHLVLDPGNYYLGGNVNAASMYDLQTCEDHAGTVKLCLNDCSGNFSKDNRAGVYVQTLSTLIVDDCGDEGTLTTTYWNNGNQNTGHSILAGGTIYLTSPDGGVVNIKNNYSTITVDGATVYANYAWPMFESAGNSDKYILKSGVLHHETLYDYCIDVAAYNNSNGVLEMCGDPIINGKVADIRLGANKTIGIIGVLDAPEGETYTIKTTVLPTLDKPVQITTGWSNYEHPEIPFVSVDGYLVELLDDGELYLTIPTITIVVEGEGTVTTNPWYGIQGTHVTMNAVPGENYRMTKLRYEYTLTNASEATVVYPGLVDTLEFDMPNAHVTIYATFVSDVGFSLYLWKGHDTMISNSALFEATLAQVGNSVPGSPEDYDLESITFVESSEEPGFSYTTTGTGYVFNADTVGCYSSQLAVSFFAKDDDVRQTIYVNLEVRVYDIEDNTFVLDYGISADLTQTMMDSILGLGEEDGLLLEGFASKAEYTTDAESYTQSLTLIDSDGKGSYGSFSISENKTIYTPNAIMDGADQIYLTLRIYDASKTPGAIGTMDPTKEVEMFKQITVLPANVVYYEDGYAGLDWYDDEAALITVTEVGSSTNTVQDGSNPGEYGNDSGYTYIPEGAYTGSGGTYKDIVINGDGTLLTFTFTGMGFDIMGTTDAKSGILEYVVYTVDEAGVEKEWYRGVLDTEYLVGEIHEAPLLHKEMPHGRYKVEINAWVDYDWDATEGWWYDEKLEWWMPPVIPAYLRLDGVRIYNALKPGSEDREHYAEGEKDAVFAQLRDMILDGRAGAASFDAEGKFVFGSGLISYVETARDGMSYTGNAVSALDDYLLAGPNNEVYFNSDTQSIVFYVKETDAREHSLQIGIRNLNPMAFGTGTTATTPGVVVLGMDENNEPLVMTLVDGEGKAISYTEQYYTVDYSKCAKATIGNEEYYRVIVSSSKNAPFCISNVKYSGLEFAETPQVAQTLTYDNNGVLVEEPKHNMPNLQHLVWQLRGAYDMLPEEELEEPVDETLKLMAISLTLHSSIGMNIYVNESAMEDYEDAYVLIEKFYGDRVVYETEKLESFIRGQISGMDCRIYSYTGLTSKEMTATVRITLYGVKDGVEIRGEIRDYGILTYAKNTLSKNVDPALKTLLVDMLNYGAQAQKYFGYHEEFLANSTLTEEEKAWATANEPEMQSCLLLDDPKIPGSGEYSIRIAGTSLVLKDKVELNYFITAEAEELVGKKLVITYKDAAGVDVLEEISGESFQPDGSGMYKVNFDGLRAKDMRVAVTCWLADESGTRMSNALTYSIESYAASKISNETLKPLLTEMMKYGDSAENFFNPKKGA